MIYSRFGSPVFLVVDGNVEKGEIDVVFQNEDESIQDKVKKTYIYELKAEDGFAEIVRAIEEAHKRIRVCNEYLRDYIQIHFNHDMEYSAEVLAKYVVGQGTIALLDIEAMLLYRNENVENVESLESDVEFDLLHWESDQVVRKSLGYFKKVDWSKFLEGNYSWYRNHYRCVCSHEWEDEWSCMCNDKCPICNTEIEPYKSEFISDERKAG